MNKNVLQFGAFAATVASCGYSIDARRNYEKELVQRCEVISSGNTSDFGEFTNIEIPHKNECQEWFDESGQCLGGDDLMQVSSTARRCNDHQWCLSSSVGASSYGSLDICCRQQIMSCAAHYSCFYIVEFSDIPDNAIDREYCDGGRQHYYCYIEVDVADWSIGPFLGSALGAEVGVSGESPNLWVLECE